MKINQTGICLTKKLHFHKTKLSKYFQRSKGEITSFAEEIFNSYQKLAKSLELNFYRSLALQKYYKYILFLNCFYAKLVYFSTLI